MKTIVYVKQALYDLSAKQIDAIKDHLASMSTPNLQYVLMPRGAEVNFSVAVEDDVEPAAELGIDIEAQDVFDAYKEGRIIEYREAIPGKLPGEWQTAHRFNSPLPGGLFNGTKYDYRLLRK